MAEQPPAQPQAQRQPPPDTGEMRDIAGFLAAYPPFSSLGHEALESISSGAEVEFFPVGKEILSQSGPRAEHLFVVRVGSVELLDKGEQVEVLEEGEAFGHPSLLTGAPPNLGVRAREETLCYLLPLEQALEALASPAGVEFVAATLERRLARADERAAGLTAGDLWTVQTANLVQRPPLLCEPDTSAREAARRMAEEHVSALLVTLPGRYGILTDTDLRSRLVAEGRPHDTPVGELASDPVETVLPDAPAMEVMIELLDRGVHHAVVARPDGKALGIITQDDITLLEGQSPVALHKAVVAARNADELARASREIPAMVVRLLDASVEPLHVARVIAATSDAIVRRLLAFAQDEQGTAPAPWAWLGFGSEARREQTLVTDQDNGLVYVGDPREVDPWFAALGASVNNGLARCGFRSCDAGIMAMNEDYRDTLEGWSVLLDRAWHEPAGIKLATIGYDFRVLAGDLDAETPLREIVARAARDRGFLGRLARRAATFKPPTGFLREFVLDRDGANQGTLDIKQRGTAPIVELARALGLAAGFTPCYTVGRLRAAEDAGLLDAERAAALREAFSITFKVRLEHQAALTEQGRPPDDRVDPREVPPLARRQLKDAFRAVAAAQKHVLPHIGLPVGMG